MQAIAEKHATAVSISVVSHAQIDLVSQLLQDIDTCCAGIALELILTLNLDEVLPFLPDSFSFPVKVVRNTFPKGFAANHNQAFTHAQGTYFCVMNPDIRLKSNPFPPLLACLKAQTVGVAAPLVLGANGALEDSARYFPSPLKILCKFFGKCKGSDYAVKDETIYPDWVGGMFLLFPRSIFEALGGFDQRYFLYYEDVDICARLRLQGYEIALVSQAKVIHHAQRSSHRNFKYLRWHLRSMARFFLSPVYWRLLFLKKR